MLFSAAITASESVDQKTIYFNIPQQRADKALTLFAEQADLTLVFSYDKVREKTANRLVGEYQLEEGISLLLDGTGLKPTFKNRFVLNIAIQDSGDTMEMKKSLLAAVIGLWVGTGGAQDAQSQSESKRVQLEEVIVTAQKRQESIQDVPISMQALSGDALDEMGVNSAEDVMQQFANVTMIDNGGTRPNFYIRGVGTSSFHLNTVGAVGVYRDEVSVNSPAALSFPMYDMERVEVLRGPQNTLFGRNTTGGAVNYITRKPEIGAETEGYIKFSYDRFDLIDLEGAVGVSLGESAALRLSLANSTRDGVFENQTLGTDTGTIDNQAGRLQLLWEPNESITMLLSMHGAQKDSEPVPRKGVGLQDPDDPTQQCAQAASAHVQDQPDCVDSTGFGHRYKDWWDVNGNAENEQTVDVWGASFKLDWRLAGITLTSITSYDSTELMYWEDTDAAPTTIFNAYFEGEYNQWAQEFRLASDTDANFRWISGLFYFLEEADYTTAARRTPAPFAPSDPGSFNSIPNTIVQQDDEVYSLYGQLEYDVSNRLTATLGLRYTEEDKTGSNAVSVRCVGAGGPPFCPSFPERQFIGRAEILSLPELLATSVEQLDGDWREWGGRLSLDYHMSNDTMVYGSVSRGFKAGGFSIAALQALLGNAGDDVDSELLWAYEIGFKSDLMDGNMTLNGAVFYYDWEGLQTFQPLLDPATGTVTPRLLNLPQSELLGAELELTWAPAEGWLLRAGLGWLDSQIEDGGNIVGANKGNTLPGSPEWSFNGLLRKEFAVSGGTVSMQVSTRYQAKMTYDVANADVLSDGSYWIVNARGAYSFGEGERYEVAVWGNELTGDEYCGGLISLQGLSESIVCQPSMGRPTYGITASMHF